MKATVGLLVVVVVVVRLCMGVVDVSVGIKVLSFGFVEEIFVILSHVVKYVTYQI